MLISESNCFVVPLHSTAILDRTREGLVVKLYENSFLVEEVEEKV